MRNILFDISKGTQQELTELIPVYLCLMIAIILSFLDNNKGWIAGVSAAFIIFYLNRRTFLQITAEVVNTIYGDQKALYIDVIWKHGKAITFDTLRVFYNDGEKNHSLVCMIYNREQTATKTISVSESRQHEFTLHTFGLENYIDKKINGIELVSDNGRHYYSRQCIRLLKLPFLFRKFRVGTLGGMR